MYLVWGNIIFNGLKITPLSSTNQVKFWSYTFQNNIDLLPTSYFLYRSILSILYHSSNKYILGIVYVGFLPGLGRVAISCCSMVTSTKLGLFEVTWRMYGGSVAIVVILAIEVGNLLLGIDKKTVTKKNP